MKLEVKNLTKKFKAKIVLRDVNFTIKEGDLVGLVGANGAGKTTIIKSIFNEYRIENGEVLLNGKHLEDSDYKIMEFFPDQNNFPKNFKIKEYCWYNYQLTFGKVKHSDFLSKFEEIIEALSLKENINSKFSQLSSGMQKRALLASVLITKPKILFLDEPTSNVDVQAKKEFVELLKSLAKNMGLIILITTHQIEELEKIANKLIFVQSGSILFDNKFNPETDDIYKVYEKAFSNQKPIIDSKKLEGVFKNEKE